MAGSDVLDEVLAGFVGPPNVVRGKMFGKHCLVADGKVIAVLFEGDVVFKLAGEAHAEALQLEGAHLHSAPFLVALSSVNLLRPLLVYRIECPSVAWARGSTGSAVVPDSSGRSGAVLLAAVTARGLRVPVKRAMSAGSSVWQWCAVRD